MKNVKMGFSGGNFFIGQLDETNPKMLVECMTFVFQEEKLEDTDENRGKVPQMMTNFVNPLPLQFLDKNKETPCPYRPKMKMSKFLYLVDLNEDVEGGGLVEYYFQTLENEEKELLRIIEENKNNG